MAQDGAAGRGEASILLVDDRRSNLLALEALLEPLGRRIVLAQSGQEALRHLLNEEFAVILLDVQMPDMDGYETARLIRERPRTRQVPIIFVTAISTTPDHTFEGYRAGAVDYILKPVDPVVLQSKVSVFVELWEAHRQLRREAEAHAVQESLALAQRAGEGGIWDWDLRPGGRLYWSPEYAALVGLGDTAPDGGPAILATTDPRDRARVTDRLDEFLRSGGVWDEEFRVVHPRRGVRWIATRGRLMRDGAGAAQRFTGIAVDVTDRRQEMDRLARLQEATASLSAALTSAGVVVAILSDGCAAAGAEGAALLVLDERGELDQPAATSGMMTSDAVGTLVAHAHRVLRDGAPLVLDRFGAGGSEGPDRDGRRSAVLMPLVAGATRAVLALAYAHMRPADAELGGFLSALATQCAEALERARLYEGEHRARERAEALGTAISVLAGGAVASEVAELVAREAVRTLGAGSAGVMVPVGRMRMLRSAAVAGYPDELVRPAEPVKLVMGSPAADCMLSRAPAVVEQPGEGTSIVALPMIAGGRSLGALVLRVPRARAADPAEVEAMAAFARLAAQALARAELHEAGQRDRERAIFMAEVGLTLSLSLEERRRLERLAALLVPRRADAFLAVVGADRPEAEIAVEAAADPRARAALGVVSATAGATLALGDLAAPILVGDVTDGHQDGAAGPWRAVLAAAGVRSAMLVPVAVRGRPAGALVFLSLSPDRRYTADDRALAAEIGHRVGLAVDNARLFEAQRDVAATLQRRLLPDRLPRLARVALASRYVSAAAETQAGGDWYEAVEVGSERLLLGVGDVVGRGTEAAAVMGQLRSAMRAYALAGLSPAAILTELSRFADGVPGAEVATTACVMIDARGERISYATAGHPPPLVIFPNGRTAFLGESHGPALGLGRSDYREGHLEVPPGTAVVLYTDGLVERRREALDRSLQRMARLASTLAGAEPGALSDGLLDGLVGAPGEDDVALLIATLRQAVSPMEMLLGTGPGRLAEARHALRAWLSETALHAGRAEDLVLAASEALSNAVEHALDGGGPVPVELRMEQRADGAVVTTVRDHGRWKHARSPRDRGRGIEIMRRVTDEVEVIPSARGTTVRMVVGTTPAALPPSPPRAPAANAALTLRTEEDAADVATLRLAGELDGDAVPLLAAASVRRSWPETVVIDITDVGFVDSAGARALVELAARVESTGAFVRVAAPIGSPGRRTIELAGIERVVAVVEDSSQAAAEAGSPSRFMGPAARR
ncbi:MAG TPA: SpoIIE family protein phosphatase [Miltoncostaeaceae bacterium]|nr:SpoIIE family protein phosphatase [Miltoncostaeaceae bacterium]